MDISAQNTFTPAILVDGSDEFDVSISGTFVATVTLQRSKDGATWRDADTFAAPTEVSGKSGSTWYYRAGVKTGDYTSGTATVELYK